MAQGLSAQHLGELAAELAPLLAGRRVREVQALPPHDLLLVLEPEDGGPILRLRLSADPLGARCHLQIGPVRRHEGPPGPFYRGVRAALEGARWRGIERPPGERILRLAFERDEDGTPRAAVLLAELFGRHANLVLLDADERVVVTLVTPASGSAASERLAPGARWTPAGGGRPRGAQAPPAAEDSLAASLSPVAPPRAEGPAGLARLAPLSWLVESHLGRTARDRHAERARKDLLDRLGRRLASTRDRLAGLERQAEGAAGAERLRQDAELLTAHMTRLKRGLREVELPDAFGPEGSTRRIQLDPGLSPRRNAERLFARHRKLLRTREKLPAELELTRAQVQGLEALLARAEEPDADLEALRTEAEEGGWLPARQEAGPRAKPEPRLPYLRFFGCRGGEIRVGRSARDNDELTLKHARGNDLWLHTSDAPGSHVVLVVPKGAEPDPEEVLDAAHLAVHYSPLRGTRKAGVHVARRKLVQKPRRAPAGTVTLSGGQERMIRMDPARLERVLATRGKPRPGAPPGPSTGPR